MTKDTNTKDIFNAAWNNDIETVKTYINNGGDVNAKNQYDSTALILARDAKIAKLLIDAGADVNAKSRYDDTALMWAKNVEIAKLLIDAGADVNAKNLYGETALALMRTRSNVEITNLLKSHGAVA